MDDNTLEQEPKPLGQYAPINGLELYFETHGTGQPLILLHGGLGSTDMFGALTAQLSSDRQVIAVDLQAHGRTLYQVAFITFHPGKSTGMEIHYSNPVF